MCSTITNKLSSENASTVSINSQAKEASISSLKNDITNVTQICTQGNSVNNDISSRRLLSRIVENFAVVWLDSNIDTSDRNYQNSIDQLRRIVNAIKIFTTPNECVIFLTNIKDLKFFLILSSAFSELVVPLIHDLSQVDSIYIFCGDKIKCDQCTKEWRKVKGVLVDISFICDQLKRTTRQCERDLTTISVISPSSTITLNELDPSFMYSQLLKEILLKIEHDDTAKKELIEFCHIQYIDNNIQLHAINEFERDYDSHSPIWWYTKESLIYSMLNRALRIQDTEIIIKMGFFLRDLHQQIEQLHSQSNDNVNRTFTVYRGQGISNIDFEKMTKSEGGLLSFNNFLSTSLNRQVSLTFAESSRDNLHLTGILFHMEIDPRISSPPFASLDNISNFPHEQEVLFSMHTVFRIDGMKQIDNRLWQVNLTLTSDNDERLTHLTKHMRDEIGEKTGWDQLGSLMYKMGKFDKAEEIYKTLLETTLDNDLDRLAFLHHEIGRALFNTGDLPRALSYYERTVEIQQKLVSSNGLDLAITYRNMGNVYCSMGNYFATLSYDLKTLEIQQNSLPSDHPELAKTYNNIGWVHYLLGDYLNALSYCEKAVEIGEKSFPSNHPQLTYIYDSIGRIHYSMGSNSTALLYYEKMLEIQRKSVPSTHPHLATSYCNIGEVHYSMEDYSTALSYFEKTLEIRQKSFTPHHPELAFVYNKIGEVHHSMQDNLTALSYYEKTMEIQQKLVPSNYPDLAITYRNIGLVHQSMGDYSTALSLYEKALEMQQRSLSPNHPMLARTHHNIGLALEDLHRFSEAIEHVVRAVEMVSLTFGPVHSTVQNYQDCLHKLRRKL
jgi:tetratricopeptide (TPR) repeat protein